MITINTETTLYEEQGWFLHPAIDSFDPDIRSVVWHVCTQRVDTMAQKYTGRYKGQRQWVDERSDYYTCGRSSNWSINTPCWRCGTAASKELQGLWRLHNWSSI